MSITWAPAMARAARVAAIPLLLFVGLAVWAFSSPVGSSPDEDWHLVSIWCGHGIEPGNCESSPVPGERSVPAALPNAPGCFAAHPDISAQCQSRWFHPDVTTLVSTSRGNFAHAYPPVFYFTMNVFVHGGIQSSVMTMRLVNAALFVGLMTATYWLLPRRRRTMLVLGAAITLVPLGVFLIASINASGWAFTSAAVLLPALVGFFESAGRRRVGLAAVALVAALMGAGARADAAVYAVIAVGLAVLLALPRRSRSWRLLPLPVLICAMSGAFYLTSGQSTFASSGMPGGTVTAGVASQVLHDVLNVPSLWAGAFAYGSWGLGAVDVPLPAIVVFLNLATFGGLVYAGLRQTGRRKVLAVVLALGAAWAIPTLILVRSHIDVGGLVQPRYILPLLTLLAEVALFRVGSRAPQVTRGQLVVAMSALGLTNLVSLYTTLRRYLTGLDAGALDVTSRPEWWWPFPAPPVVVWAIGSLAFAAALVLTAFVVARDDTDVAVGSPSARPMRTAPASEPAPRPAAA